MSKSNKFGTFGGVFVPSILTILGVIMYLRLPMIVGEAGLWATIGIIVVAHIISFTTGLSVSSIATDKKVQAGGTYYMISRSLGLPLGGTLGLALFVGLSFSVSLYLIGFSESFLSYWGFSTDINNIRLTGSIILVAVTTLTFISTSLAIKTQYFILVAILLSLISVFFGQHEFTPETPVVTNPSSGVPLMVLFGIFFPAVTGFEAGVSMSGDLKDPKKSIPHGSIMAIVIGFLVYIGLACFLAFTIDPSILANDPQVLLKISWIPELVIAGIWGATLSSALGSILGAPRILQATAIDNIIPKFFGKGYGPTNEPRNALLLTFLIAEIGILIGELDVIARVVSIFFITTYGFLNISAAFERWTSADYRPEFKIPGWISLVGSFACIIVMIQLDFVAMLAAVLILGLLYFYLKRKELTLDTGDTWGSVWASLVKSGITNLTQYQLHKRNWRPNVIMFSGSPGTRQHLVEMGLAISGKLGILTGFELIKSENALRVKSHSNLEKEMDPSGYFMHKLYCQDVFSGMDEIARVYGFSGIEPNTVLMGWSKQPVNREKFIHLIESFGRGGFNTLFLNYDPQRKFGQYKSIDIWWSGRGRNLALAINLIRYISNSLQWRQAKVRLFIIIPQVSQVESVHKKAVSILDYFRGHAEINVIANENMERTEQEIIATESAGTDLTILGVPDKRFHNLTRYYDQLNGIITGVGSSLIINASDYFEEIEVFSKEDIAADETYTELNLPELAPSRYKEITQELEKIDEHAQLGIDILFQKSFDKIFSSHKSALSEMTDRVKAVELELGQIKKMPESYKRKKAIDKLKIDNLFKLDGLISKDLMEQQLEEQHQLLADTLKWYVDKLEGDFKKYPRTFKVSYERSDFNINSDDSIGLRAFKRWKRLKHWVVGQPITDQIPYREIARYYQFNSRLVFLKEVLHKFYEEENLFYNNIRKNISGLSSTLDEIERKIWVQDESWSTKTISGLSEALKIERNRVNQLEQVHKARIKLEFRKNLQLMGREMEKFQIKKSLARKTRSNKHYKQARLEIQLFSEKYFAKIKTLLNMVSLELAINNTRNRQESIFEEFYMELNQTLKNNYLRKLEAIVTSIAKDKALDFNKTRLELDFDAVLFDDFERHLSKMVALVDELPESVELYSFKSGDQVGEQETVNIPILRMAEYFLKSRYETPVEEAFGELTESLKRSVFTSQDALSLAQFSLENIDGPDEEAKKDIYQACLDKLDKEKLKVQEFLDKFKSFSGASLDNALEPLQTVKIQKSAEDFQSGLRTYQGHQMLTGVEAVFERVRTFVQGKIIQLWYSRSETILKARRMDITPQLKSTGSQLLDLKERLNPASDAIHSLPQYYVTLFNGKSNIGRGFWIKRPIEEMAFKKGVARFHSGYAGGILLLGERNSGKTAFSRHMTQTLFKPGSVHMVFPPTAGSHHPDNFAQAVASALQKRGPLHQMVATVPANSVLIINDLELFWERSEEGMEVIEQLGSLIDEFGDKVLFVVNMNPHAFKVINQLVPFGNHFIDILNMNPFDAEDIQELILKRHKSSGMAFGYEKREQVSELQLASLFNAYFDYSKGNPGSALNGWLAGIKSVEKEFLQIDKPINPSLAAIKNLDDEWIALLVQFVLHKRLTAEKIQRIFDWSPDKTKKIILAMLRSGIIVEKLTEVYHIDSFMHPFVVLALKSKEVL